MSKQSSCEDPSLPIKQLSLTALRGIGPKLEEKLHKLGIHSVQDLLFHLPLRYQDRTRIQPLGSLLPGEQVVVEGTVDLTEISFGRKRMLLCHISDGTGSLLLRFFHFSQAQKNALARGTRLRCYGEVRTGMKRILEMIHPEYDRLSDDQDLPLEDTLTPYYPTTEGLHQLKMRDLIQQALQMMNRQRGGISECLPDDILKRFQLFDITDAIRTLHYPPAEVSLSELQTGRHPAQQRLAFEELLAHYLSLRQLRLQTRQQQAVGIQSDSKRWAAFTKALPFQLTQAQQRVIDDIEKDLSQTMPMMRLLQGDVGSGKTLVAAAAALAAIDAGYQVALMAPTEILSTQHVENFKQWLQPLGIEVVLLSGKLKTRERRQALESIASNQAQMVIGTHALFQQDVVFDNLALVIIDEQHRFGVHQRLALREKAGMHDRVAHQLIMTATPIPRTLAMTAYADLDVSVIDELPPGRVPVTTIVIPDTRRDEVLDRVKTVSEHGSQVYWVCTLIEESETLQCQTAVDTAEVLRQTLPALAIDIVHGRMKSEQKDTVMNAFKRGEIDLLVATTVIEVGVDVPNASLMIIENAERLGLSQLHQLRGRVGRGAKESHCVLFYQGKLSAQAHARLAAMRDSHDGFVIAQKDLELRGPGEVLGTRQTGIVQMRIADLLRDQAMMPSVQSAASIIEQHYPDIITGLVQRWLGTNIDYAKV